MAWRTDITDAAARDDIAAAVDITAVAGAVRDELAARPRTLVERMTADVARRLLDSFAVIDAVRVRVEKPDPEDLGAAAESVEITLTRENAERAVP